MHKQRTIDNTKKLVLEGLSEALHVSVEWLKGETEEYETDITDKRELFIRDVMSSILSKLPFDMEQAESDFTKDLLLLMLREYELFVDSFQFACKNFNDNAENAALARTIRFVLLTEYHNHTHISITFPLNFFLPPFSLALLPIMLSSLVLKLPRKVLPVIADNFCIR